MIPQLSGSQRWRSKRPHHVVAEWSKTMFPKHKSKHGGSETWPNEKVTTETSRPPPSLPPPSLLLQKKASTDTSSFVFLFCPPNSGRRFVGLLFHHPLLFFCTHGGRSGGAVGCVFPSSVCLWHPTDAPPLESEAFKCARRTSSHRITQSLVHGTFLQQRQ